MKLILFDIDATLIHVRSDVTRNALRDVVRLGLGHEDELAEVELHGKTDRQIMMEICQALGRDISQPDAQCDTMGEHLIGYWERTLNRDTVQVLPGVFDLLERLQARDDVQLALLTGNLETGARLKLAPHDLNRFFPFGAFGSDAVRRDDLPPIALERANAYGGPFTFERTLIVGDSHRDISCARAWGIRSLAVATGSLGVEELRSYAPDSVCRSLAESEYIFDFIESN